MLPRASTKSDPGLRLTQRWHAWLLQYVPGTSTKESIDVIERKDKKAENQSERKINLFVSIDEPRMLGDLFPGSRKFSPSCMDHCLAMVSRFCAETKDFRFEDEENHVESAIASFVELYDAVFSGAVVRQPFRGIQVTSCTNVLFIFQGVDPVKVERIMKAELKKVFGTEDLHIHGRTLSLIWVDGSTLYHSEGPPERYELEYVHPKDYISSCESESTGATVEFKRADNKRCFDEALGATSTAPKKTRVEP